MNTFDLPAADPAAVRIREAASRGTLSHACSLPAAEIVWLRPLCRRCAGVYGGRRAPLRGV